MKNSSAHKRSRIQPELNHRIESKLLITSVSRQAIGAPSAMLSRYDHMRHEEELQKEYNLKFLTDRKRTSSGKKHSASKRSGKETKRDKMGDTMTLQPQRLFFQSDQFRQKYYNLHETHLKDKQKWISDAQKFLTVKEAISNFFISPDQYTARDLSIMLDSEKVGRSIEKYLEAAQKYHEKEELIREIMKILQVRKSEDVLENLRARVERFRNLDECTFKILELESVNKKVINDFEEKLKKMKKEIEQTSKQQSQRMREELEMSRRSKMFLEEEVNLQKEQYQNLLSDITKLTELQSESSSKWKSGRPEVLDLQKYILGLGYKLRDIEIQAEQNMFRLLKANEDIVKLEQLMGLIKDDMNKQLSEQEQVHEQDLCEIGELNKQMNAMEQQIEQMKQKCQNSEYQLEKREKQYKDEMNLMAASLGLTETHSAKLNLKIQQLVRALAHARLDIQQKSETIKEKDELIVDLSRKIERFNIAQNELQDNIKKASYEKEQYKFLLNNLREQVGEMKKGHNEEKNKILKEKDQEIVRSNRDILESYSELKEESQKDKLELAKARFSIEEKDIELGFVKNKFQQVNSTLREKQAELMKINQENQRYKKYLKEIQTSFKEVVQLQEASSKKVASLESENKQNLKVIQIYQTKNQELDQTNNQLIQARNQFKTSHEKTSADLAQLQAQRLKLESINVQLRLQTINKQSQISKMTEELKSTTKQCKSFKLANEKLLGQLNAVTRKLVMYRVETKKKYGQKYKVLREIMTALKMQYHQLVKHIHSEFQGVIDWTIEFMEEMLKKVQIIKEGHNEQKSYLQELRELEQDRYNEQLKLMEQKNEEEKLRGEKREEQLSAKLRQKQNMLKNMEEEREIAKNQQSPQKKELKTSFLFHSESKDKKENVDASIHCNLSSVQSKQILFLKLTEAYSSISLLISQNKQLKHSLHELKNSINQEYQFFLQWFSNQCQKQEENSLFKRGVKRRDTPIFPQIEEEEQKVQENQGEENIKFKEREIIEEDNNNFDEAHLMEDIESDKYDEGDNVNSILQILVDGQTDIPTIPYWKKIEGNFLALRRKLTKKNFNLKLDLSAIDSKDHSQPSPSSINYGQSQYFSRRVGSEPDDGLDLRDFKDKETHRSQKVAENGQMIQILKRENEQLKLKILSQTEQKSDFEQKIYQLKMVIQDMEIKLVSLENETSIKGLEHNFKKVLDYILCQNGDFFEQSCRIIMKMLHFTNAEINDYQQKISSKKKKKKTGLFGGLFKG